MSKKKLLLHTCCAPCLSGCLHQLDEYELAAFYFNPNISSAEEHDLRFDELRRLSEIKKFPVIQDAGSQREWMDAVRPLRFHGERSERCLVCFRIRLEHTFIFASQQGYDLVATTLTVSPHKDSHEINAIGEELSQKYGISYHPSDFKKNDGFRISVESCREYSFYRQNYCGCVYSQKERDKNSRWNKKQSA